MILTDWNIGKIKFFTVPPVEKEKMALEEEKI